MCIHSRTLAIEDTGGPPASETVAYAYDSGATGLAGWLA